MSSPTTFLSGTFKGDARQLQEALRTATFNAADKAADNALDEFVPTIAKETRFMRLAFRIAVKDQIRRGKGSLKINLNKNDVYFRFVQIVSYGEHHLEGRPHHKGQMFYDKPRVPGTVPIQWAKFSPIVVREFLQQRFLELRKIGISIKRKR